MEKLEKMTPLVCSCGSRKFKVVTEQLVNDVFNLEGINAWTSNNELTIEKEKFLEVVCVECGKTLVESYHEKPIPYIAWKEFWSDHVANFIMSFEHYAVNRELSNEDQFMSLLEGMAHGMWTQFMSLLEGMAHGMWTLERFIEAEMVQEEEEKPIKGNCISCGGPLALKLDVRCLNADGTPSEGDTSKEPYCPRCGVFWESCEPFYPNMIDNPEP